MAQGIDQHSTMDALSVQDLDILCTEIQGDS